MADLSIYTEEKGPRALFIITHLFSRMLGWSLNWVEDAEAFKGTPGPKLAYSQQRSDEVFTIVPSGFLALNSALPSSDVMRWNGHPVMYPSAGSLPFDLLAFAFFLISRTEEYSGARDAHGRFRSSAAWTVKNDTELLPILDELILALAEELREKWPELPAARRSFSHTATFDIDNGLKYTGREGWRSLGSLARDLLKLRFAEVARRLSTLLGRKADPYELNGFLKASTAKTARKITFFLVGERSENDHAVSIDGARMAKKLRETAAWSELGLHPSYRSMEEEQRLKQEHKKLSKATDELIVSSRQHFLKFQLPGTYKALIDLGIGEEHSMGFSDRIGFRAGTCTPFPWYDLEQECETTLMILPFCVMDSALCYQMKLSVDEAIAANKKLVASVRRVEGNFESIWHERFIAGIGDEKGWDRVYSETLECAEQDDRVSAT